MILKRSHKIDTARIARSVETLADDLEHATCELLYIEETINGSDRAVTGLTWHGDLVFILMHLQNLRMQILTWERDAQHITGTPDDVTLQRRRNLLDADSQAIQAAYSQL